HTRLAEERSTHPDSRRWEVPRVYPCRDGNNYYIDVDGEFWRAISFIDRSTAFPRIQSMAHAREAGYALGRVHSLISDMSIDQLHDTLVGFHITPGYLSYYDSVLARTQKAESTSSDVRYGMAFIQERRAFASVLEDAKATGQLPVRPMHGDPKIDNIMIDDQDQHAISMIDLDTVKPGLVHYDLGDCLRSCCNLLGEETTDLANVRFESDMCREILGGYLGNAGEFFTQKDYDYLFDSIRLITFELGLRFFTDHLEGNVYFKARHREHNLHRALVQFKLAESIETHERDIRQIVADLR
ncbi:MAG TPA: aminoglycoside phosphotransferase family protein, partial [Anaerolineae bacterium]